MWSDWQHSYSQVALDWYWIGRVAIHWQLNNLSGIVWSNWQHSDSQVVLDWYWNGLDFSHCGVE